MNRTPERTRLRYQLWGWVLFVLCALLFLASSVVNGDVLAAAGSLVFLLACGVFLVPVIGALRDRQD
jgi:energy-coupling factor transporter transmembrane protein EcfT